MDHHTVTVSATFLYETILEGYPAKVVGGRTGVLSPPLLDDTTGPVDHLELLCARWNKSFADPNMLESDKDFILINQHVMNPRLRLWSAAVAYALLEIFEVDTAAKAELDDTQLLFSKFATRDNNEMYVAIFTADNNLGPTIFNRRVAAIPRVQAAYSASVNMHTQHSEEPYFPDDYYDTEDQIFVTVTLIPLTQTGADDVGGVLPKDEEQSLQNTAQ